MPKTADRDLVMISPRIPRELRDRLKESKSLSGRTFEREVQAVLEYAFANGYQKERP